MTEETREVWALARRVDPSEPYDQWGVFEDGAAMAENVRNELEDELTEDEESEAGKAELIYTLGKIQPPADDANEWYVEAYDDDAAYHAVRVGFVTKDPTATRVVCRTCGFPDVDHSPKEGEGGLWFAGHQYEPIEVPDSRNWQEAHPGVCCTCGRNLSTWDPADKPVCVECYNLINEED